MRRLWFVYAVSAVMLAACSRIEPLERPEPDSGSVRPTPHPVYFCDDNPTRVVADGPTVRVVLGIGRANASDAPASGVSVGAVPGDAADAWFDAQSARTAVSFDIAVSTTFRLIADELSDSLPVCWHVDVLRSEVAAEHVGGILLTDSLAHVVDVEITRAGGAERYSFSGATAAGGFTVDGAALIPDGAVPGDVASRAIADEGIFALSYGGGRVEYLLIPSSDSPWSEPEAWEFTDGWLLPVVSWQSAEPLDPAENPWIVWVQRSADGFRILDLYRGASPLSALNSAAPASVVRFTAADGMAEFCRQPAGFACEGLFAYEFEISGMGTFTGDAVEIPLPLHADASGVMTPWLNVHPSRLCRRDGQSSIIDR